MCVCVCWGGRREILDPDLAQKSIECNEYMSFVVFDFQLNTGMRNRLSPAIVYVSPHEPSYSHPTFRSHAFTVECTRLTAMFRHTFAPGPAPVKFYTLIILLALDTTGRGAALPPAHWSGGSTGGGTCPGPTVTGLQLRAEDARLSHHAIGGACGVDGGGGSSCGSGRGSGASWRSTHDLVRELYRRDASITIRSCINLDGHVED